MPEDFDPVPQEMDFGPLTRPTVMFVENGQFVVDVPPRVEFWVVG
jgi:hypothetical protein